MKIKFLIATIAVFGFVFFLGYKALAVCVSCSSDANCSGSQICDVKSMCGAGKFCQTFACRDDADCLSVSGRKCTGGFCERTTPGGPPPTPAGSVPKDGACTTTVDCEGAWACVAGVCKECTATSDCYGKGVCVGERCTGTPPAGEKSCAEDRDCEGTDKPKCDPIQHICVVLAPAAPEEKYKYEPVYPSLQIPIPGVPSLTNFAKVEIKGEPGERYVYIPWISQYIAAVYGWAMGIVGILATVMIVWGGVIYLTAGGTPERISTAKDYITSALAGLLLAFGSYLLLYTINPDLVKFGAMKIKVIERKDLMAILETTTVDTAAEGAEGKDCRANAQKMAYEKLKNEIPGWPDSYIQDLVPGDRIVIFNANSDGAGLHAAVFMGWAGTGNAKVVWGGLDNKHPTSPSDIKSGTYCLGSNCPSSNRKVIARIFAPNDEPAPSISLPSGGCPFWLTSPSAQGPDTPRAKEFKDKVAPLLTAPTQRGKILQAAQFAVNCKVNLGSCGKTVTTFNQLSGAPEKGKGKRNVEDDDKGISNWFKTIKCK